MNTRSNFILIFMTCVMLLGWSIPALAEQAILRPIKDNTIYQGTQFEDNSCGAGTGMIAGKTNVSGRRRRSQARSGCV